MKIFKDIFSNDEMMSELFPYTEIHEKMIMRVPSSYKYPEQVGQVDIGCGNAFGGEEESAGGDEPKVKVLDIPHNFNLVETSYSKAEFTTVIKGYLKDLKTYYEENDKEKIADMQKGLNAFLKEVLSKYDDYTLYTGSSEKSALIFSKWEDDSAPGPIFFFIIPGLKETKY